MLGMFICNVYQSFILSCFMATGDQPYLGHSSQGSARPSFDFRDRVWDWTFQGLNFKTESDTKIFSVSVLRPNLRLEFPESQFWDWVQDSNFLSPKSQFWDWVRVYFLNYQFQDRIRDWNFSKYQDWVWDQESLSLSHELSLRLVVPVSQLWGRVRDWSFVSFLIKIKSETRYFWSWW